MKFWKRFSASLKTSRSFIRGYARALDLNGVKEWPDISESCKKDYEALMGDWENVGKSFQIPSPGVNERN